MSNEIVKLEFTDDQVALIKSQIAPRASDNELKLFLYQAKRTGLDPLARQIYCIPIGGKMSIQTSIDGFRVVAERSGDYAGQDEPQFTERDGKLVSCKVTVYRFRGDLRYPAAVGVAFWDEYKQSSPMWTKMPHTMLAKCAEALALRKAYPQDLSGIYTTDEMAQAQEPAPEINDVPDEGERQLLRNLVYNSDLEGDERELAMQTIESCSNYALYQKIQHRLEERQKGFDDVANPNAKDVNKKVRQKVNAE